MERFLQFLLERKWRKIAAVLIVCGVTLCTVFIIPPFNFPRHDVVVIPEGTSIRSAATILKENNVIRSEFFFTVLAQLFGGAGVRAGSYSFNRSLSVFEVAYRMNAGTTGLPLIKITIPEGSTAKDVARILNEQLASFDEELFLQQARKHEGYLFPETYLFTDGVSPETVIQTMRNQFEQTITPLEEEITQFGVPVSDVVIMASLLEKEARLYETKQIVAGILWKRIEIGMPLQVDAVFGYILDVDTFSPTFDQLEIDSPYNTYKNLGLPPGAIANPGLESLRAAVTPVETPYLYYLTGSDGTMHYGRTFDEHVANRRFLR